MPKSPAAAPSRGGAFAAGFASMMLCLLAWALKPKMPLVVIDLISPVPSTDNWIAIVLTGALVAALVAFRRRLSVQWVIMGIASAAVLAAVGGFVLAVIVAMSLHW